MPEPHALADHSPQQHSHRCPPAPVPPAQPLGVWAFFSAMRCNSITAWPKAAYEEPFLHWPGRYGVPELIFVTDPAMVRRVLIEAAALYDKGEVVRRRLGAALGDSVLIAQEASWKPQRRVTAPLFQPRRTESFFPDMLAVAREQADYLATIPPGTVLDMRQQMLRLTYEVISRTAFSSDSVRDPAAFSHAIARYFDSLGRLDMASYLRLPRWIPTLDRLRAMGPLALFRREIGGIIARRRALMQRDGLGAVPDDVLTRLMTAIDPQTGETMSPARVYDNALTFLAAGHETTANVLAWTLFLLSEYPDWNERVVAEIEDTIQTEDPTLADLPRLTRLRMVVDEALRLYPPAPLIPREALADDQLGPIKVRKGTVIFTSPYVSQRHRRHWETPDAFLPDRFEGGVRAAIDRHIYFPFGLGPRVCIGAGFAMQEVLVTLAVLLRRYRFVATAPETVFPQATITLKPGDQLAMRLERR